MYSLVLEYKRRNYFFIVPQYNVCSFYTHMYIDTVVQRELHRFLISWFKSNFLVFKPEMVTPYIMGQREYVIFLHECSLSPFLVWLRKVFFLHGYMYAAFFAWLYVCCWRQP
jgi:hypothetical protein